MADQPTMLPSGPSGASAVSGVSAASGTAGKAPLFAEPLIDKQNFLDWGQACRVRQIQDKYNEMLEKASDENLSLDQYLKKNNMKDHTAFLMQCPQFPLLCWPSAFSELGSGFVLYFDFLIFLGCFLFLSFVVQMPAVMEYWDKDNFKLWRVEAGENATEVLSSAFIYTSPGMLGPKLSDADDVPFCYFVLVCFLCAAVVAHSAWQLRVDAVCDAECTHPNDFAIMVEGLPATATDEESILNFFKAHAIRDNSNADIVKVVIGWDAKEYRDKMRAIKELQEAMKNFAPGDHRMQPLQDQITAINAELMNCAPDTSSRLMSSGVVVVSFRYQTDMRRCLDRWQSLWATWAYRDWGAWNGICGGPPLPRFPTATGIGVWKIKVDRAPNPGDINWDDLGVSREARFKKLAKTNGLMCLVIGASLGITYVLTTIKEGSNRWWLSALPAFGIAGTNMIVLWAAKYFGKQEFHNTVTGQEGSIALKMTLGVIVNTAVVMLCVNTEEYQWYKKDGLVSDILMLIGVTAVMQPVMQKLDFKFSTINRWKRSKLKDAEIKRLRAGAEWYNANPLTKETLADFKKFRQEYHTTIAYFNAAFEPSEMDMKRRYAYAVRTFVCCMCYCHLAPFISLLGIVGIMVQYWIDKKMLLRWYKRSSIPQGMAQAKMSLFFLRFTTLVMPLCMWFFISPSFKGEGKIMYWMGLSYAPAAFICFLPITFIRHVLGAPCRGRSRAAGARVAADDKEDYYTAQYLWPKAMKYHKSHGLYKGLPEAKNPEFLDENTSAFTKVDDVKASYGAATAAAVSTAAAVKRTSVTLAGGVTVGGDADAGGVISGASSATLDDAGGAVAPTIVGASAAPAVTAVLAGGDDGGGGGSGGGGAGGAARPNWEMEIGGGWSKFDDDCLDHLERQFQKFKGGGQARVTIRTKGMALSLDFEKMTQMKKSKGEGKGKNKVIKIRRSEGP